MRLLCTMGWHSPSPQVLWNAGFWFTKCRDCDRDLVRSRHRGWHVPVGAKVVWQAKPPAARPPVEPVSLIAAGEQSSLIEQAPPARFEPAEPTHSDPAPSANDQAPADVEAPDEPPKPLAPAERLDLARFVAEMLSSAGPAVPIQHAVLAAEPEPAADVADIAESLVAAPQGAVALAAEAAPEIDLPQPEEPDGPRELGVPVELNAPFDPDAPLDPDTPLDPDGPLDPDAGPDLDVTLELDAPLELVVPWDDPSGDPEPAALAPAGEAEDEQAGPGKELEYAEAPQLEGAADVLGAAAVEFEAPAVPIAPPPAPPPARDADPWADFLDDNDGDDDDFAWAQEDRTEPPAPAGAPARRASERAVGASDRPGAQRLNEPFRSDVDRRKHLGKNSVKR